MKSVCFVLFILFAIAMSIPIPDEKELQKRIARFAPVKLSADISHLSPGDKLALKQLIYVCKWFDPLYMTQCWDKNLKLADILQKNSTKSLYGKLVYDFYQINRKPWSSLDDEMRFTRQVDEFHTPDRQPATANYYPEDITVEEFQNWVETLSKEEKEKALGFFHVIRRDESKKLKLVPYSQEYKWALDKIIEGLRAAASFTTSPSLRNYLTLLCDSMRKDDYFDSDVAWLKLDSPLDITLGPYETYMDKFQGLKAAFEGYITVVNPEETKKLQIMKANLQNLENNLPMPDKFKRKLGESDVIRVVDSVYAGGESMSGVQAAAFNLPNDPRVITKFGSKRVMLNNVQHAKFDKVLTPISEKLLNQSQHKEISYYAFFTHVVLHELCHGLGPQEGVREALQELYSPIEEAKADITGLFGLQFWVDTGLLEKKWERSFYITFLASSFRTMRFGVNSAHGRGHALQFNYINEYGGFVYDEKTERFHVNFDKVKEAVKSLANKILVLQGEKDKQTAKELLDKYGKLTPTLEKAIAKLTNIPIDIKPEFPLAEELINDKSIQVPYQI